MSAIVVRAKLNEQQHEAFRLLPGRNEEERIVLALGVAFDALASQNRRKSAMDLAREGLTDAEIIDAIRRRRPWYARAFARLGRLLPRFRWAVRQ